jgi:hypothetical protein
VNFTGLIRYVYVMHSDHDQFIKGIDERQKVLLVFFSQEDGRNLERTCAPMDFGPTRTAKDDLDRYHFWDYDSDEVRHPLMLMPDRIVSITLLDEQFEPGEFVSWPPGWHYQRDWGDHS